MIFLFAKWKKFCIIILQNIILLPRLAEIINILINSLLNVFGLPGNYFYFCAVFGWVA